MRRGAIWLRVIAALGLAAVAYSSSATNGLTLIGTGAESIAMGGADVAVARDTAALSTNPAGLTQIPGSALDSILGAAFAAGVAHADQFGNDKDVSNWAVPVGGVGVSKSIGEYGITLGIGLFAQAGAGAVYNNLDTPFGGQDTLRAQFGVLKVTPGFAWRATDTLAIGAAINVYYATLEQRFFPNTSSFDPTDPARTFFGTSISNASSVQVGGKLGMLVRVSPDLSLGVTYVPKIRIPFDNGTLTVNYSSLGLGAVTYREVRVTGLTLPQEITAGFAWQANEQLLLAFDLMWSDYSHALQSQSLYAAHPDNTAAPPTIASTIPLNWHNQTVIAGGFAYAVDDATRLYSGVNYGRNPIPSDTLNPLLASTGEWHVTGGFARRLSDQWNLSLAFEYLLPNKVTYDNPYLPFGPGAQERDSYVGVTVMLSRHW